MQEVARAKINLALHVRGREPDGYHRLETVFAFAQHGDLLQVAEGPALTLQVEGPFATGLSAEEDNLVLRAARALRQHFGAVQGAALTLTKNLPVASGIGGGSADAAAALRLLNRYWRLGVSEGELVEIARPLGADVPACVLSRSCLGSGKGDQLTPYDLNTYTGAHVLLVNPGIAVSTVDVFRGWGGKDSGPLPINLSGADNDLEAPAKALAPAICSVLEALAAAPGATLVRMSGSGATCFALFDGAPSRDAAAARIAIVHPDWWQLASRLG